MIYATIWKDKSNNDYSIQFTGSEWYKAKSIYNSYCKMDIDLYYKISEIDEYEKANGDCPCGQMLKILGLMGFSYKFHYSTDKYSRDDFEANNSIALRPIPDDEVEIRLINGFDKKYL